MDSLGARNLPQGLSCRACAAAIALLIGVLQGCRVGGGAGSEAHRPTMVDCQLQKIGLLHLHLWQSRGSASLITEYQPGRHQDHADAIREGRESEGRLVPPGPGMRYAIELFLLNDHFGESAAEKVVIRVAPDGRTRLEAKGPAGPPRLLDVGTCSSTNGGHGSSR